MNPGVPAGEAAEAALAVISHTFTGAQRAAEPTTSRAVVRRWSIGTRAVAGLDRMMRILTTVCLTGMLAVAPAFAQYAVAQTSYATAPKPHVTHSGIPPVDHGPYTAEANRAYQGGGMILQGAPGAPAPQPEATPPGQTPRNMVPQ